MPDAARLDELRTRILAWYAEHRRDLPWRRTTDPYAVLVSEVMLQQTQVSRVVPYYRAWLAALPDLESLAAAPLDRVLRLWQGLGYNNRAQRLRACAQACMGARAPGATAALPRSLPELQTLPGLGAYTARAVLAFAYNDDVAAVDANVRRVLTHELGLPPELPARRLQDVAEAALPRGRSRAWHNALMDYGALVLTSRATGITPPTRQSRFEGSRRQRRSRVLRALLSDGAQSPLALAGRLELPLEDVEDVVELLRRDGLVTGDDGVVSVA